MTSKEIRQDAWESLKGNWMKGLFSIILYLIFDGILAFILRFIPFIGGIIFLIISTPFMYTLYVIPLKISKGEDFSILTFLGEGLSLFSKIYSVIFQIASKILPFILAIIAGFIIILAFGLTDNTIALIGFIIIIASCVLSIPKFLLYEFSFYILNDNPYVNSSTIVEESEKLMYGNRLKYVILNLSFIGWILLTLIVSYAISFVFAFSFMTFTYLAFKIFTMYFLIISVFILLILYINVAKCEFFHYVASDVLMAKEEEKNFDMNSNSSFEIYEIIDGKKVSIDDEKEITNKEIYNDNDIFK